MFNFPISHYVSLFSDKSNKNLETFIKQSNKNIHTLKNNIKGNYTQNIDKEYTLTTRIKMIFTDKYTNTDLFRICSSEYKKLSLNILDNAPYILYEMNC